MSIDTAALIFGSGGFGALLAAAVNWLNNRRQVRVSEFEAITAALNTRIDDLQEQVDGLEESLADEKREHGATRKRLRAALRHIRAMMAWLGTDRSSDPPDVPQELVDEL